MSTCATIRPLLLEADPEVLAGEGGSDVAVHIRECPACAAAAAVILEETAALDRYLARGGGGVDVDAILAAAGRATDGNAGDAEARSKVLIFPSWKRWTGLAAAAAIAGLLFFRPDSPQPTPIPRVAEALPVVESAPDQNVAVLETTNPQITVLWFF